jgi:transposase-like protein
MSGSAPKRSKRPHFTLQQKAAVLAFVRQINAKQGEGGHLAAARKFNLSPLTISQWMKKTTADGVESHPSTTGSALERMRLLLAEMGRLERHLSRLRAEFDAEKSTL